MDADAMDRHMPSSSGEEAIYRTSPVIDPLTSSTSHKFTDSTVIDAYASSPEAIPLKQFTVMDPTQMHQLHSSVKKNINTRTSKY